jgi:hypothetical protein
MHGFKQIYWFEFSHRLPGRTIGTVFLLPFLYFLLKGYVRRSLTPKLVMLFVLGGLQGVLGWYMVKSGCAAVVNGSLVCEPENGPGRKGAGLKPAPAGSNLQAAVISRDVVDIGIAQRHGHRAHHRVITCTVTEGLHLLGQVTVLLTRKVRPQRITADTVCAVTTGTADSPGLAGIHITRYYRTTHGEQYSRNHYACYFFHGRYSIGIIVISVQFKPGNPADA